MSRKLIVLIAAVSMLVALLVPGFGLSSSQAQAGAAPIRLEAAQFTPAKGESPDLPPGLTIAGYAAGQRGYYIVQFGGPVLESWKAQVEGTGAEILGYIPDFAFKVRMNPGQAQRVERLASVSWVGLFHPAYKLSQNLTVDGPRLYTVRVERGVNAGLTTAAIAATGAQVFERSGSMLLVGAEGEQIEAIARVADVAWVQDFQIRERENEYGGGAIMGADSANAAGYDGSGQTVAVADTGLGDGTASGAHADIPGSRVSAIYNWPGADSGGCYRVTDDGAQDVDSGHGTHVSASVLSDGDSAGVGKGTAPAANLVFQATENYVDFYAFCSGMYPDGYYLIGIPADIRDLFSQAYSAGARVHSNSWGSNAAGDYTADSANLDDFIWNNVDMTITTSAGNAGVDEDGDGVVDNDSIGSPATAKNVLTVGASENDRQGDYACDTSLSYTDCAAQDGQNDIFSYGSFTQPDGSLSFPADPLNSDLTAGGAGQMAAFSSRGPTDDGRIKPDVVAPGTWVLSGYSDLYQQGYDGSTNPQNGAWQYDGWGFPYSQYYKYMGGTSMSNPLTAGGAAVVRDFYQATAGHNASAALVKATLINSAVDMLDENNDGADDNDYPIPNVHEGWGRVNLANATDGGHEWFDVSGGLSTGGSDAYTFEADGSTAFKVSLAWSDYPSTESASVNLVNDLDLVVTSPSGTVYRGNEFSGGWSQSGGSADRRNNVENVYVESAEAGTWSVEVRGYNVPNGPQPYALVLDGAAASTEPTATPTAEPSATPTDGPTPTPTNTPEPTNTPTNTPEPTATNTPSSDTMHVGDLDGNSINNGSTWTAQVTIRVHDASHNAVSGALVSGAWSSPVSSSTSCTTDSSGICTVSASGIHKRNSSVTFTVNNVSDTLTYDSDANHDPDGDSDGTSISVPKP